VTRAGRDRTGGDGFRLKEGRFRLDVRSKFIIVRVVRPWPRLPRGAVAAPSLAVSKDGAGSSLGWWKGSLPVAGGWNSVNFKVTPNPNRSAVSFAWGSSSSWLGAVVGGDAKGQSREHSGAQLSLCLRRGHGRSRAASGQKRGALGGERIPRELPGCSCSVAAQGRVLGELSPRPWQKGPFWASVIPPRSQPVWSVGAQRGQQGFSPVLVVCWP